MSRVILGLGLLSLLLWPAVSFGDARIPPDPNRKPDKIVPMTITYMPTTGRKGLQQPQLHVPKKFLVADAGGEREPQAAAPANRNLFSGLALTAAFVTGGLWFVRRSGKGARAFLVLFILSGTVGVASFLPQVYGNIRRFPNPPDKNKVVINGRVAKLNVQVVIVGEGEQIQLFLPESLAPAAVVPPPAPKVDAPRKGK